MNKFLTILSTIFVFFSFAASTKASRPNFVLFQVDDMPNSMLFSRYLDNRGVSQPLMPNLEKYFAREGSRFTDFAASSPLCAPSRASLLSGRYSHNTRLVGIGGPLGGAQGWQNSLGLERNNIATRLQEEGYKTAHFGKWLNHYGSETEAFLPSGWNTWVTDATDKSTRDFYGYRQRWKIPRLGIDKMTAPIGNENYNTAARRDPKSCTVQTAKVGVCNYHSDLMTRMAADEISSASPFYIQIDYHAPHGDHIAPAGAQVASRHEHLLSRVQLPRRTANFNEADISDKSYLTQEKSGLLKASNISGIETFFRHGMLSLRAVDDGIGYIARTLEKQGLLNNTYLIFVSDNGFFYGNHRFLAGKTSPYEESSKVPFFVRGPGVPAGSSRTDPAATVDLAPTILSLARARPLFADGISLVPYWSGNVRHSKLRPRLIQIVSPGELTGETSWQTPLLPRPLDPNRPASAPPTYRYRGIQLGPYKYFSYDRGGEELYNLASDPFEINSLHRNQAQNSLLQYMRQRSTDLRFCRGRDCSEALTAP